MRADPARFVSKGELPHYFVAVWAYMHFIPPRIYKKHEEIYKTR